MVASICERGIAGGFGGDERIGLGQAFMMSGSQSVIVSLWNIDDESSAYFMECFYKDLLSGSSKSKSLQSAIVKTRDNKKWSKPYYWAPFILIGDWE
ncbi:MAG: CHAT domain-containing protein [Anaerolineales bacterium]|nr:CHAT domain-containing protein [Anaerolineales bacterium]